MVNSWSNMSFGQRFSLAIQTKCVQWFGHEIRSAIPYTDIHGNAAMLVRSNAGKEYVVTLTVEPV